jgi:hypothetical protein
MDDQYAFDGKNHGRRNMKDYGRFSIYGRHLTSCLKIPCRLDEKTVVILTWMIIDGLALKPGI